MKDLFRLIGLCVAATLLAGLSHASDIITTYDFTGDCGDCDGQGTGTLVLQNYTLGDPLETSNFVSFTYSSNISYISTDGLDPDPEYGFLEGMLPVDLPGPANVGIGGLELVPGSTEFEVGFESLTSNSDAWQIVELDDDYGTNGIWSAAAAKTAVPEPSSFVMLAAGLAGLVAWRRRHRSPGVNYGKALNRVRQNALGGSMKDLFRLGTLCVAVTLFAGLSHAGTVTYDFTGDCCDDSGGLGSATGTLVLQNYTPGDELETSNFVSLSYSSPWASLSTDSLTSDGGLFGVLPVDVPGPENVSIGGLVVPGCSACGEAFLDTYTTNYDAFDIGDTVNEAVDYGSDLIWSKAAANTAVPEPSSLVTLAAGIAGLVAWRLRRRSPGIN
jgi:hypothetical protein